VKRLLFPQRRRWDRRSEYFFRTTVSRAVNDSIVMETDAANKLIYQPWIAFSCANSKGKYVNAYDRIRNTTPSTCAGTGDTVEVWFLGGSTMFGLGVTDAETVPAAFVRIWKQKINRPIKVVNYGTPLYYSYQELMVFADNLFRGRIPQMVIMLDGLNDGSEAYSAMTREPYNTSTLQQLINPEMYPHPKGFSSSQIPDSINIETVSDHVCDNYLQNIANIKRIADGYNVQLYCFWQPIPYYHYRNRSRDLFCAKGDKPQYGFMYPYVEQKARQINYLYSLADILNEERYPFLDSVHYTPQMCEVIARHMLDSIANDLRGPYNSAKK
jgi:lysophospholipase L1-like esterase